MRTRQHSAFTTIASEGALLPVDLLQRISQFDADLGGINADAYHYPGQKLNEMINDAWTSVLRAWRSFEEARTRLPEGDSGLRLTRERWMLYLFAELGYGRLFGVKPLEIEGKSYAISHGWQHVPLHLVSFRQDLDQITRDAASGQRSSPYSLVQELLNRSPEHLWGMVSNGLRLRLLRKNASLTRQAYVEFDLEAILRGEAYADFALLWLLCHQSRVEGERASDCWLEKWSKAAQEQGVRALEQLRKGVEQAINALGSGFLAHADNRTLKEKLRSGTLAGQAYYNQVLRLVYRLLILFVAEDREILFDPQADALARQRYNDYYSTARLRRLAAKRLGTRHTDLFRSLWLVMEQLGSETGCPALGLPALNGFLFSTQRSLPDLLGCELENHKLLDAVRALALTLDGPVLRSIDYKNLGAEELGSVYELLLELHPELDADAATFTLSTASGNARKTSGSYYTPTSLIDCLLDSALEPMLKEAREKSNPEKAILALKVCDPACGSGHFLIAAAHRIARVLAAVRTGTEEPGPDERRAALRDVVAHCIYGVDINPMAVELCKVSLWMEAIEPGKPLSFLDAHIKHGNSLLGATPRLLREGIPDEAFEPIEGDDKKICSEFKKLNKNLRAGQQSLFREDRADSIWEQQGTLMHSTLQLEEMREDTVEEIHRKEQFFVDIVNSGPYANALLWANAWCAAFVWKKTAEMRPPITDEEFRDIGKNPFSLSAWRKAEIERLAAQYQFFHWHLAFPEVFLVPEENPENEQAGWSGGFDVVLGNPPYIFGEDHNRKLKHTFQTIFSLATGQYDMYWLFIEQGLKLTNHSGKFGFVVPDALLARDEAQNVRKLLLEAGIENIYHCGMVFEDADVSTIVFNVNKESTSTKFFSGTFEGPITGTKQESSKSLFLADSMNRFLIHISYEESIVLARVINTCETLQSFVKITRGEEMGKKGVLSEGSTPILVGSDISRYCIEQPSRFLNAIGKDPSIYRSPKIVIVKTGSQCIASLEPNGYVTMQSVYNLHITVPKITYEALLAVLNSRFVRYFIYKTFTSYKSLFPQLNQSTLQAIPIPQNIYDLQKELIMLVNDMHRTISMATVAKTSQETNTIQRELEILDKKIDLAIYNMYGLNSDEINLLEQNIV